MAISTKELALSSIKKNKIVMRIIKEIYREAKIKDEKRKLLACVRRPVFGMLEFFYYVYFKFLGVYVVVVRL